MSRTNDKKAEYRDKNLGHEPASAAHLSNVGDKLAARQQGQGASADAGATTVHLQMKNCDLPAISRENNQLATRVRQPNPVVGMGSHVSSEAPERGSVGGGRKAAEKAKEANFGYGSSDRSGFRAGRYANPSDASKVKRVEASHDRKFNSKGEVAPNNREK